MLNCDEARAIGFSAMGTNVKVLTEFWYQGSYLGNDSVTVAKSNVGTDATLWRAAWKTAVTGYCTTNSITDPNIKWFAFDNETIDYNNLLNKPSTPALIQKNRGTTNASGQYTWTFPTAFSSTPTVVAVAEDATSGAQTNVQIISLSTTAVTFQVNRLAPILGILTLASAPSGITLDMTAM